MIRWGPINKQRHLCLRMRQYQWSHKLLQEGLQRLQVELRRRISFCQRFRMYNQMNRSVKVDQQYNNNFQRIDKLQVQNQQTK